MGERFIALDLEYDPHIWLTGVLVSDGERREHIFLWVDNPDQEKRNLLALAELVGSHPSLPVITWSGISADMTRTDAPSTRYLSAAHPARRVRGRASW